MIYIDVYFFLNFAVDFFALFSVEKMLFIPESKVRCFLGALLGGCYSVICFFYPLSPVIHLIAAAVCVYTVTCKKKFIYLPLGLLLFFSAEVFMGGCVTAVHSLLSAVPRITVILPVLVVIASAFGIEIYGAVQKLLKRRLETVGIKAKLWHRGRCSELLLMIDSGNLARDSVTGRRIIFVKADAIKHSTGETDTLFEREKCYVIPIKTASGSGTVLGFIPDKMEFSDKEYNKEVFIVVPDRQGAVFGCYDGIAPLI